MQNSRSPAWKVSWLIAGSVYGGLFLITLWLAYTGHLPKQLDRIPFYDKIGHVVLYAIASFLGHRLLNRRCFVLMKLTIPLWPALFSLFTLAEEGVQAFSPNRTFSGIDLLCSLVGVGLGYWLAEQGKPNSAVK